MTNEELNFFLQNGVKECTNHSESNLGAQSYCFDIPLKGHTYPAVSNQSSLKALSKAYPVTNEQTTAYREGQSSFVENWCCFLSSSLLMWSPCHCKSSGKFLTDIKVYG